MRTRLLHQCVAAPVSTVCALNIGAGTDIFDFHPPYFAFELVTRHLGFFSRSVIPTGKGFSTFYGYYGGAEDYFTHKSKKALDLHNDTGHDLEIPSADGDYSTFIYTQRAKEIIQDFALRNEGQEDKSLFM